MFEYEATREFSLSTVSRSYNCQYLIHHLLIEGFTYILVGVSGDRVLEARDRLISSSRGRLAEWTRTTGTALARTTVLEQLPAAVLAREDLGGEEIGVALHLALLADAGVTVAERDRSKARKSEDDGVDLHVVCGRCRCGWIVVGCVGGGEESTSEVRKAL